MEDDPGSLEQVGAQQFTSVPGGKRLSVPPPVIDSRKTADAIVRLADHPRNTVVVGGPGPLLSLAQILVPNLAPKLMKLFFDSYFAAAEARPTTTGNLFQPSAHGGSIDGGLRSPQQRSMAALTAGGIGLASSGELATRRGQRPRYIFSAQLLSPLHWLLLQA